MRLSDWMDSKGFSYRNLSDATGVAVSVIEYIVNGKTKNPHPKTMRIIAEVLGVEIEQVDEFAEAIRIRKGKDDRLPEVNLQPV